MFPRKCIFQDKKDKFLFSSKSREKSVSCHTFIADERIRQSAIHKDDKRIISLAADETIIHSVKKTLSAKWNKLLLGLISLIYVVK